LGALGKMAAFQPADRALVPDLHLVPGGVVLPIAVLLGVAVGGDPQGGDLLAARDGADFSVGAGEADELNLVEHHVSPIDRREEPRRPAVPAAITRPAGPGKGAGPKPAGGGNRPAQSAAAEGRRVRNPKPRARGRL